MLNQPAKKDPYQALRFPEFRLYIAARFLITIAISIQAVIIGWEIYSLTHDKLMLGFIGLTEAIPAIGIAMYGGYVADKSEKRMLTIICISAFAALSALLILVTHASFIQLAGIPNTVLLIFGIIFLTGLARGFAGPASFSLATFLIPKETYLNGATWSSSSWQLGAVIGPALGGLLYAAFGITITFSIQLALLVFAIYFLARIKPKPVVNPDNQETIWESVRVGLDFVFKNKVILSCITLDLFAVLFGGAVALLPVFAKDILHTGPLGLGMMRAAPALGAIITLLTLAYFPIRKQAGMKLLAAVFGFGLFIILFGISTSFLFSLFCLAMSGALDGISVAVRHTIIQLQTPQEMRGRVAAVNSMFIGSSNEIGEFESGATARFMGTVPAVVFGGCMTCLVVITTYFISPAIRKMELNPRDPD
jgi:MFS family permease